MFCNYYNLTTPKIHIIIYLSVNQIFVAFCVVFVVISCECILL